MDKTLGEKIAIGVLSLFIFMITLMMGYSFIETTKSNSLDLELKRLQIQELTEKIKNTGEEVEIEYE